MGREFYISHRAYYGKHMPDRQPQVVFGVCDDGGGTGGEAVMRWHDLNRVDKALTPRLEAFSDSWRMLASVDGLRLALASLDRPDELTVDAFVALLTELGFRDATQYEAPDQYVPHECSECGQTLPHVEPTARGDSSCPT